MHRPATRWPRRLPPPPRPLDAFLGVGIVLSLTGVLVVALLEGIRRTDLGWLLRSGFCWAAGEVAAACALCGPIVALVGALALFHRPTRGPVAVEALACLVLTAPLSLALSLLLPDAVVRESEWLVSPTLARVGTPLLAGWHLALLWRLRRPR